MSAVVAIYPHAKAIGYALMDSPTSVCISNYRYISVGNNAACMKYIASIIFLYKPACIVLESNKSRKQHRGTNVQEFFLELEQQLQKMNIPVYHYSREDIRTCFGASCKEEINHAITQQFPEYEDRKPKETKVH